MRISDWSSYVCSSDLTPAADDPDPVRGGDTCVLPDAPDPGRHLRTSPRRFGRLLRPVGARYMSSESRARTEPLHTVRHLGLGLLQFAFGISMSSEARRVGKGCVSPCKFGGAPG